MTARILESVSNWLVDWSILAIMGRTMPPRDPNVEDMTTKRKTVTPSPRS
jgi:hypothetical protein